MAENCNELKRKVKHELAVDASARKALKIVREEEDIHKIQKSREQNREHAKKTRLRKKSMLEGLKAQILQLQTEVGAYVVKLPPFVFNNLSPPVPFLYRAFVLRDY